MDNIRYSESPDILCSKCYMFCHCGYHQKTECGYFKKDSDKVKYLIYEYGDHKSVMKKDIELPYKPKFKGNALECIKWANENNQLLDCLYVPHSVYERIDPKSD